jgi:hypothetical protein
MADKLIKNMKLNPYSHKLLASFLKLKSKIITKENSEKLRSKLFSNDNYHEFVYKIQKLYLSIHKNREDLDKLLKSIMKNKEANTSDLFVQVLDNDYEKHLTLNNEKAKYNAKGDYSKFTFHGNLNSQFMSETARKHINNSRIYVIELKETICDIKVELRFYSDTTPFDKKHAHYKKMVRILNRILFVIAFFKEHTCDKNEHLVFDLFLVDCKKRLPSKKKLNLGEESINSGYTMFFGDNSKTIVIYRDEEMEKLIIHEMIHFFYLDFYSLNIEISTLLNVSPNLEFIPNESFAELITIIMHTSLLPIENKLIKIGNKGSQQTRENDLKRLNTKVKLKETFYLALELLLNEILFGYFQCAKILYQYNINYSNVFFQPYHKNPDKKIMFYQKSCILSYFFIKIALLTNFDKTIEFYFKYQTNYKINTEEPTKLFYKDLIFDSLKATEYQDNIQNALDLINSKIFTKSVMSKLTKKCQHKTNPTNRKLMTNTKHSKKMKKCLRKSKRFFKNDFTDILLLNTRMSIVEL